MSLDIREFSNIDFIDYLVDTGRLHREGSGVLRIDEFSTQHYLLALYDAWKAGVETGKYYVSDY